jgi:hypothetical protein
MIPINILALIYFFVLLYFIGLLFTVVLFIEFIKDKKVKSTIICFFILVLYILFGLGLL